MEALSSAAESAPFNADFKPARRDDFSFFEDGVAGRGDAVLGFGFVGSLLDGTVAPALPAGVVAACADAVSRLARLELLCALVADGPAVDTVANGVFGVAAAAAETLLDTTAASRSRFFALALAGEEAWPWLDADAGVDGG